jgi:hypothetical protein
MTELTPNGNNDVLFGNLVRTDGFSVDFLFYKRFQAGHDPSLQKFELALDDFNLPEVEKDYTPISLDPGIKAVFTATVGLESSRHLKCSTSEYYHMTGSTKFSKDQNKKKLATGIDLIESGIPSSKTTLVNEYSSYMKYMLLNKNALFEFYDKNTPRNRFQLYQGVQRATDQMANIVIHGTVKYNRRRRDKDRKKKKKKKKEQTSKQHANISSQ